MKLKSFVIGGVMVLCAGLAVFALTKWHREFSGGDDDEGGGPQEEVAPLISVQTSALKRVTLHRYVDGYGIVEAAPATAEGPAGGGTLSAPTAGVVAKVNVLEGQQVKEGDVLMELNSGAATYNYAKAQLERQRKLLADQNTSLKNVQDAEAQLRSLQVVAPFSGTVTRIFAKVGAAVDANAPVAEVIDLNRLAISAPIATADARELKAGQEVQIGKSRKASLSFVSPAVETADGTVLTRTLLPPDSGFRPGEFVALKIVTETHTNCLAAPAESVVADEERKSFIVLVNGEEAARLPVKVGLQENGWAEVEGSGLADNAAVVTAGAYGFPEKAKIRIANSPAGDAASTNSAAGK